MQIDGGYMRSYGPLNEAIIRGAGHLVLVDKTAVILQLYKKIFLAPDEIVDGTWTRKHRSTIAGLIPEINAAFMIV